MGDYRENALQVVNSDGSYDVQLKYESHEIYKGKKGLQGLPASYGEEEEVETLVINLVDEITKVRVALNYSVFAELDTITRSVEVKNGGEGQIYLEKVMSCCLDFMNRSDFDYMTFYGKHT